MGSISRVAVAVLAIGTVVPASEVRAGNDLIFRDGFQPPDCVATPDDPRCAAFTIQTPPVQIEPGQEIAYCYYFHTPNAATVGIRRFQSTLGAMAAHIIVYATYGSNGQPADRFPPGTLSSSACGSGAGNSVSARRVYQAHETVEALDMPADDGSGVPVAIELLADQPLFVEMYFVNVGATAVMGSVALSAFALPSGDAYTRTASYMTYNGQISIPPHATNATASANCAVPPSVRFWWFSTHTHSLATNATLLNGTAEIVSTSDWESPTIKTYGPPAFYQFVGAERLTYTCTYFNPTNRTVTDGDSYVTDENCVGIAYFFPADRPLLCFNNFGPI